MAVSSTIRAFIPGFPSAASHIRIGLEGSVQKSGQRPPIKFSALIDGELIHSDEKGRNHIGRQAAREMTAQL